MYEFAFSPSTLDVHTYIRYDIDRQNVEKADNVKCPIGENSPNLVMTKNICNVHSAG
jgi:hypothetical protein